VFFDEIGEVQGAGEAARTGADDQDISFELFALDAESVGHLAMISEEENGKEKMENTGGGICHPGAEVQRRAWHHVYS
jgi:hypothetical protein